MQTFALDYGPQGSADVTANVMETVPSGAVLHEDATPDAGYPLVVINQPYLTPEDEMCIKVHSLPLPKICCHTRKRALFSPQSIEPAVISGMQG